MAGVAVEQRFPFINLEKGLGRAEALYKADDRGADMSVPTAFEVWDYSDKSSGGHQTLAALKMYGLLIESESDVGRKIRLSDEALRYFRDERDEERTKLLRQFALSPPLIRTLWNEWGAQLPSDTVARSHLKIERKLNEQSARTFLGIYKYNLAFTGLKGRGKVLAELSEADGPSTDGEAKAKIGDYIQWTPGGVDQFKPARRVTWVSPGGSHVRVHGNPTGIPMSEISVVDPPAPPQPGSSQAKREPTEPTDNDINVFLTGNRLQITADVDAEGIKKMRDVLVKYEEILKLLSDSPATHGRK